MPRIQRIDIGDHVYHIINRANAGAKIFYNEKDYQQFEDILAETVEKFNMRLLAYCLMPNHWHLVLYPKTDGELSKFMSWLTNTHTRRWHTLKDTVGHGHLYQGRYKSFLCQNDHHLLALLRYVERNALRANMVKKAEEWKWGSAWVKLFGKPIQKRMVSEWQIEMPKNYLVYLNESQSENELVSLRASVNKTVPFGDTMWVAKMVDTFKLGPTTRRVGRPKK